MKFITSACCTLILLFVLVSFGFAQTETYEWSNFSGKPGGSGSADGAGNDARFTRPSGVTFDRYGNAYVADSYNHTVRKITPGGVVSTMAGKAGVPGNADGIREEARFYTPTDVAVDDKGNVFVTDFTNNLIRKITPDGVVSTYAGDRINGSGSTDGPLNLARFYLPAGMDIDSAGNLFIAETGNRIIRKISADGIVSTIAGTAGIYPRLQDGTGPAAIFNDPSDVVVAPDGVLYVADTFNNAIRKITLGRVVTTLPGTGTGSTFPTPLGIERDAQGNLYVSTGSSYVYQASSTDVVMKITPEGTISTLAGLAGVPTSHADGTGSAARFFHPSGLVIDPNGNLLVADAMNHALRKVTLGGVVTTPIGAPPTAAMVNGTFSNARYSRPNALAAFGSSLFLADSDNCVIRKITANGNASTFAGTEGVAAKATGAVGTGKFKYPEGVTVDASGNLYVADTANHSIRKTNTSGVISNIAGGIFPGSSNGSPDGSSFNSPSRLSVDASGTIYVADRGNVCIRKITATTVSTLAGSTVSAYADGTGAAASFRSPNGLTLGNDGNLRLADTGNHAIRQITPGAVVTTLAGGSVVPLLFTPISGTADGTGIAAQFNGPFDLSFDSDGNLIVVDSASHTIRKVTPVGVVTTIGGTPGVVGGAGGIGPAGLFSGPRGVATIGSDIYISDTGNNRIMKGVKRGFRPMLDRSEITTLGNDTATLHGTVNPNGSATTARFEYGFTASLGSIADVTLSPGSGLATQAVSATLAGLTPGTAYFYRLSATNAVGTSFTRMGTFVTPTPIIEVESPKTQTVAGLTTLAFDPADIQQPVSQTLFVKNPGSVALAVYSITAVGESPQDFQIAATPTASIVPGASAAIGITFIPAAKGSRRAVMRVTSNDPAKPVLDIALAGTGLTQTESWRNLYFQQTANTGEAADLADPDKDGVNNLLERAFNLHPLQSGASPLQPGSGTSGMPVTSRVAQRLRIEFVRRKSSSYPGMIYEPLFSSGLESPTGWSPTSRQETTSFINDQWERVIAEDDLSGASNRFARIRVISVD
ncbi:MAG: hypothetical protein ABI600_15350 [Luteolibacter sp.]